MQRKVYNKLFSLGWYVLEKSTQAKINKTISQFAKSMQELE